MKKLQLIGKWSEVMDLIAEDGEIGEPHGEAQGYFEVEFDIYLYMPGRHSLRAVFEGYFREPGELTLERIDEIVRDLAAVDDRNLSLTIEEEEHDEATKEEGPEGAGAAPPGGPRSQEEEEGETPQEKRPEAGGGPSQRAPGGQDEARERPERDERDPEA